MAEENQQNTEPRFAIEKIYLKDVSFESPNAPAVFTNMADWKPEVNVQLNSSNRGISENLYEVVLMITVTAKQADNTAFLVEIKQAGVFMISGFPQENMAGMLNAYCPETLFPFAREAIAEMVSKGGFPQFLLAPINFNELFMQQMQKQTEAQATQDTAH